MKKSFVFDGTHYQKKEIRESKSLACFETKIATDTFDVLFKKRAGVFY
jgi:hypothetical protein